jgi:hypothetical protein
VATFTWTEWQTSGEYTNCLRVVFTNEVFTKVLEFYTELAKKRLENIMNVITANLSENEAGLLILKDEDRAKLHFPNDIEVFLITPPSYDDLIRWVRDQYTRIKREEMDSDSEDFKEGASG